MWTNYHTHSTYCDGKDSLKDLIAAAGNLRSLGFSSHAPLPLEKSWSMKAESFESYLADIRSLQANSSLPIHAGLEVDFIPEVIGPHQFAHLVDYTIGSIHFVDSFPNGDPWEIDSTTAVFEKGLKEIFRDNIVDAVVRYYELVREMVDSSCPTIVGHLDKIKMHNSKATTPYFNETDPWYQNLVDDTLWVIKESGAIVEVNTRGVYKGRTKTTYPSPWVLLKVREYDIPVTLSSDAHTSRELSSCFGDAALLLMDLGFQELSILEDGNWNKKRFTTDGILG